MVQINQYWVVKTNLKSGNTLFLLDLLIDSIKVIEQEGQDVSLEIILTIISH